MLTIFPLLNRVFFSILTIASAQGQELTIGDVAPSLEKLQFFSADQIGTEIKEGEGKILILDFWATWCGPCRDKIPHLIGLQKKYAALGVQVIGIAASERGDFTAQQATVAKFVQENPAEWEHFSIAFDPSGKVKRDWLLASGSPGIPTIVVLDQEKTITYIGHGLYLEDFLPLIIEGKWRNHLPMNKYAEEWREYIRVHHATERYLQQIAELQSGNDWEAVLTVTRKGLAEFPGNIDLMERELKALLILQQPEKLFPRMLQISEHNATNSEIQARLLGVLFSTVENDWPFLAKLSTDDRLHLGALFAHRLLALLPAEPAMKHLPDYLDLAQFFYESGEQEKAINVLEAALRPFSAPSAQKYYADLAPIIWQLMANFRGEVVCQEGVCYAPRPAAPHSLAAVTSSAGKTTCQTLMVKLTGI